MSPFSLGPAPVLSVAQLRNRIGLKRVGDQVDLTVDRHGNERNFRVRVDPGPTRSRRDLEQDNGDQ